jgi:RNA polymerase sigma-70 factor, ECF subfamily
MSMEETDGEIVRRIRAGDVEAFASLIARYRDRGARFATRMLGSVEDAEEVLQDAFVRAFRAIDRCEDPERFDRWFFSILANRCRSAGSRIGRRQRTFVEESESTPIRTVSHPEDRNAWREELALALGKLDAEQREAFLLKHVEDMSYEEMAGITGASVPALKMRVKRACDRLRGMLQEAYTNG